MMLKRIKHMFFRLSPEEKAVGLGQLLVLIGMFMPWYAVVMSFEKTSILYSGFSGDLGVIGFVIFIMVLLATLVLTGEYLHFRVPQFGYTKEQILFFLMGQSAFLILLVIAVYTKRSLDYTSAELRFGIYMALIGACLGTFAAFAQMQKLKKKDVRSFFEHEEEEVEEAPKPKKSHKKEKLEETMFEEVKEEKTLFEPEKEMPLPEESDFLVDEGVEIAALEEEEPVQEIVIEEAVEEPESKEEVPSGQGDFFAREAGLDEGKPEEEPAVEEPEAEESVEEATEPEPEVGEKAEKEKKKKDDKGKSMTFDFYQDE